MPILEKLQPSNKNFFYSLPIKKAVIDGYKSS